jgi:hypothetical protein
MVAVQPAVAALDKAGLGHSAKIVALVLADACDELGVVQLTQDDISHRARCSKSNVTKSVAQLRAAGLAVVLDSMASQRRAHSKPPMRLKLKPELRSR